MSVDNDDNDKKTMIKIIETGGGSASVNSNTNSNNSSLSTIPSSSSSSSSLFCSIGSETTILSDDDIRSYITKFLQTIDDNCNENPINDVVLVPPDYTRYHSYAGQVTQMICEYYNYIDGPSPSTSSTVDTTTKTDTNNKRVKKVDIPNITILPALGTHEPMSVMEIEKMYGTQLSSKVPSPFHIHDWRNDIVTIGTISADTVSDATSGFVQNQSWPAQINKIIWDRRIQKENNDNTVNNDTKNNTKSSIVLSIGQVVPHEVMGMANYNKNLFVGTGGADAINMSHYIGAVIGMEKIMGRTLNPLRDLLNNASKEFLEPNFHNLWYILTVIGSETTYTNDNNNNTTTSTRKVVRGLYIGRDIECYLRACELSLKVNFTLLDEPIQTMVVYLDPDTYHSTWLGNKAIYRTRMALASGGQLIILAPGIKKFGEDPIVDSLIRQYGYTGTETIMNCMKNSIPLQQNLSAVAHLLHGSSDGRFTITYCPGYISQQDIEKVGFQYADLNEMLLKYDINTLNDGWNTIPTNTTDGTCNNDTETTKFYYISNPGLGLWATKSRFFTEEEVDIEEK